MFCSNVRFISPVLALKIDLYYLKYSRFTTNRRFYDHQLLKHRGKGLNRYTFQNFTVSKPQFAQFRFTFPQLTFATESNITTSRIKRLRKHYEIGTMKSRREPLYGDTISDHYGSIPPPIHHRRISNSKRIPNLPIRVPTIVASLCGQLTQLAVWRQ